MDSRLQDLLNKKFKIFVLDIISKFLGENFVFTLAEYAQNIFL